MKPRVAVFSFTSCEGCSLAILECENELLDILNLIELVEWREAMSEKTDEPIDIALIDGSISTRHGVEKIKQIRERAKMVVAIGACAHTGGLTALKNRYGMAQVKDIVYGEDGADFDTIPARPVSAVVPVEFALPGCPIDRTEFITTVRDLVLGKTPKLPDYPVCVECKKKGNVCVFFQGKPCMGPVTRAGCGAACPSFGDGCEGCRGFIDDPNKNAHKETLAEFGLTVDEVTRQFDMFNSYDERDL
jgi:coenzyme F420-reducing hydrogenase gamma subunit